MSEGNKKSPDSDPAAAPPQPDTCTPASARKTSFLPPSRTCNSEQRLELVLEASRDGLWEWDNETNLITWSDRAYELLGIEASQFDGAFDSLEQLCHPDDRPRFARSLRNHLDANEPFEQELRFRRGDGSYGVFWIGGKALRDQSGKAQCVAGFLRDVTIRRRAEEALRASDRRLRALLENSADAVSLLDKDGLLLYCSPAGKRILGYSLDQLVGRNAFDLVHPDDRQDVRRRWSRSLQHPAEKVAISARVLRQNGAWRILEGVCTNRLADPSVDAIVFNCRDVTEREQVQVELGLSQQNYEGLVNTIDGIVWEADPQTFEFFFVSSQAERILGYPVRNWLEIPNFWPDHIDPRDRGWAVQYCLDAVRDLRDHEFEYRMIAADGRTVWLRDLVTVIGENDQPVRLRGVMVDVTKRKEAEKEIEILAQAVRSVSECVSITDMNDIVLYVNHAFLETYGFSEADLLGKSVTIVRSPNNRPGLVGEILPATLRGGWRGELLNRRKDGSDFPVLLSTSIVRDESGTPRALIGVGRDISEQKLLEDQLVQSQKMEAVGRLAGGIAHDFNNLLTAILGYSGLALSRLRPGEPLHGEIDEVRRAGERAAALTQQLLAFSRKQVLEPTVVDLNGLIAETDKMLKRIIGENVCMVNDLGPLLGKIRADRSQIEQTLVNLVVNARDAMPRGGTLTIVTRNTELDRRSLRGRSDVAPGRYVMLAVSDSGSGMTEEVSSHIFEPFYTTKGDGGTGLGLSTVYGIVRQSGGYIAVESSPGRGSTFLIYFPLCPEGVAVESPAPEQLKSGSEVVLLVEDEQIVRDLVWRVLGAHGYVVLQAASAEEAAQIYDSSADSIGLILTDVVMPGMSGPEMIKLMQQTGSLRAKVLYMSGYTDEVIFHQNLVDTGATFLPKPFTSSILLQKVREVLDS